MMRHGLSHLGPAIALWLLPALCRAQTGTGSIAGTVRDTTGAVLPGVTVEAVESGADRKSPDRRHRRRGADKIIELPPGVYTVTFTLSGFAGVQARRHRAEHRLHGHGQRRPAGRQHRRNDHRLRPESGGRYAERPAADGDDARSHRRDPHRQDLRQSRRADPGRRRWRRRAASRRRTSAAPPASASRSSPFTAAGGSIRRCRSTACRSPTSTTRASRPSTSPMATSRRW